MADAGPIHEAAVPDRDVPRPTSADATRPLSERDVVGLTREVARGGISRRQFLVRAAALGLTTSAIGTVLAACGTGDEPAAPESQIEKVVPEGAHLLQLDRLPGAGHQEELPEGDRHQAE